MVLPKPWQRGQAPMGLLKLNRLGSGSANSMPQRLQANFSLKRSVSPPWTRARKIDFARFAIADLDGVDQALVHARRRSTMRSTSAKTGLRKIDIEQRFGRRELEDLCRA